MCVPQRGEVALFTARVVDIDSIPPTVDRSISLSLHAEWAGELWSVQQQQQAWRRMEVRHRIVEKAQRCKQFGCATENSGTPILLTRCPNCENLWTKKYDGAYRWQGWMLLPN